MDLEDGQSCPRPHIPPTSEMLGILFNLRYTLISLSRVIFALAHETICILYLMVGLTHHTRNPVIYILHWFTPNPVIYLIDIVPIMWPQ